MLCVCQYRLVKFPNIPSAFTITAIIYLNLFAKTLFPVSFRDVLYNITMGLPLIFSLGDSLIRRLNNFVGANPNCLNYLFLLVNVATFQWHDVMCVCVCGGGRGGGGWGVECGEDAAKRPPCGSFIRSRHSYLAAGNH